MVAASKESLNCYTEFVVLQLKMGGMILVHLRGEVGGIARSHPTQRENDDAVYPQEGHGIVPLPLQGWKEGEIALLLKNQDEHDIVVLLPQPRPRAASQEKLATS